MNTSTVSGPQTAPDEPGPWLLLVYQLPPKPDYLRVKVRRRLQGLGAIALRHAAYLLPRTEACLEDFQWLRREIVADGGEATVCAVALIEGVDDAELVRQFRRERDAEYQKVTRRAGKLRKGTTAAAVERLRKQIEEVAGRDFFGAPARSRAEQAVDRLQLALAPPLAEAAPPEPATAPRGVVWITRRGVYVDRIASAWLIRRFIDPEARFKFVASTGYRPRKGELRFDMFEGEFTHEGDRCTFETLLHRFGLRDPALRWIAEVVHDLDFKDARFGHAEAAGIATVLQGLCAAHAADADRVTAGSAVFDGLYARARAEAT